MRSARLREENRVSLGLPGQVQHMPGLESAICNLRCAACDWPTAHVWPRVCELQPATCGLRLAHGSCLALSLPAATCDVRLATGHGSCLASSLPAGSCDVRLATCRRLMPGLESASCNLRRAACDWPTARGSRIADRGLRIRMQNGMRIRNPRSGQNGANCELRAEACESPAMRWALDVTQTADQRRAMTRLQVAGRRSQPVGSGAPQMHIRTYTCIHTMSRKPHVAGCKLQTRGQSPSCKCPLLPFYNS